MHRKQMYTVSQKCHYFVSL